MTYQGAGSCLTIAATLEQEMGRRSVAEAIRPIKERAVASSSSAGKSITQEMVAEACDTLVRERHPASQPVWPEGSGIPAQSQLGRTGETGVLTEPPLAQRKTASTPRPERDGSPREAERKPEPAVFSPSPVVGQEKPPPMRTHVPETEESEARKKIHPTLWRDLHRTWKGTRKQRSPTKRRPEGRNHRPN